MSKKHKDIEIPEEDVIDEVISDENEQSVEQDTAEGLSIDQLSVEELLLEIQQLRAKNSELTDQHIRAKAETENTRRISSKEVEKARKFALERFSKELLLVKDSLDQAARVDLEGDTNEQLIEQMSEGLGLTLKQLDSIFEQFKICVVNPEAGDPLDPELHQAMTKQPSDEVDSNNIIMTIQVGYTLNERLLRPAMVIVSSGPA